MCIAGGAVWRALCNADTEYGQTFNDFTERQLPAEFTSRLVNYANMAKERRQILSLPVAEAMITYKENEESSQVFVPFICETR